MNKKAFTLIELIVSVVIIAIAFYSLVVVFVAVMPKNISVEDSSKAVYLANKLIEQTTAKAFGDVSSSSVANFPSPSNKFSYQLVVDYVTIADPEVVSASPTELKRVRAKVWTSSLSTIEVRTLVASYES